MKKNKNAIPIHGWLILDKPLGISSAHAVAKVKNILRPEKIGHAGTLDPLASGILPLALGEATKTVMFLQDSKKAYRFMVTWGEERSTDDAEGEVVASSEFRPTKAMIETLIPEFMGDIHQIPPQFSAIKQQGKRAYDMARAGEEVIFQPRQVTIYDLKLIATNPHPSPLSEKERELVNSATFEVECGKGTYVRSIARDMGRKLGCFGYVSGLRRTKVGKFDETCAISLDKLEKLAMNREPLEGISSIESVLDDILALDMNFDLACKFRQGIAIRSEDKISSGMVYITHHNKAVGLGRIHAGLVQPTRIFNY